VAHHRNFRKVSPGRFTRRERGLNGWPGQLVVRVAKRQEAPESPLANTERCPSIEQPLAAAQAGQASCPGHPAKGDRRALGARRSLFKITTVPTFASLVAKGQILPPSWSPYRFVHLAVPATRTWQPVVHLLSLPFFPPNQDALLERKMPCPQGQGISRQLTPMFAPEEPTNIPYRPTVLVGTSHRERAGSFAPPQSEAVTKSRQCSRQTRTLPKSHSSLPF
jgi:hypothetical protein